MGWKVENTSSACDIPPFGVGGQSGNSFETAPVEAAESHQTETETVSEASVPQLAHYLEEYYNVVYDRKSLGDLDELDRGFVENTFRDMTACSEMECFRTEEDMARASQIYAISFYDGKVHVQGGPGYEDKARAYEQLLNVSLPYIGMWSWHGRSVSESSLLEKLNETLHYYMDYDNQIYEENHKDSIVNHVDDAFSQWYEENKPKPFEKWA